MIKTKIYFISYTQGLIKMKRPLRPKTRQDYSNLVDQFNIVSRDLDFLTNDINELKRLHVMDSVASDVVDNLIHELKSRYSLIKDHWNLIQYLLDDTKTQFNIIELKAKKAN